MRRTTFHHYFYLLGIIALVMAMPLSHFVMGLASFLLFLNWIAEWNWREKRILLRKNRQGLWFAAFYLVYAIGLIHVTDWSAAGNEMLAKPHADKESQSRRHYGAERDVGEQTRT